MSPLTIYRSDGNKRGIYANAPRRVTSLPTSPVEGQEVYLVLSLAPNSPDVVWHMRYNASLPKWEFVGGSPMTYRQEGENNGYVNFATGTNITVNAAQNKALQWNLSSPVDIWAEYEFSLGIVQKVDAAYHYAVFNAVVSGTPVLGTPAAVIRTQHASVNVYEQYIVHGIIGLSANTSYAIYCNTSIQGGTWQYNQQPNYLNMTGRAWPR
jgi:hypothetical protein